MSLQRRLLLSMLVVTALVTGAIAAILYGVVRHAAWQQHERGLNERVLAMTAVSEHDEGGYEYDLPPLPPGTYLTVWLPDGRVLTSTKQGIARRPAAGMFSLTLPDGRDGEAMQVEFVPRDESGGAQAMTLTLAEGVEDVESTLATVRRWFLLVGVIAFAGTATLVSLLVRGALSPLPRLAKTIENIDDRSLDRRISREGQPTELVAPIDKLNDLLARLSASFGRERQFTADVSHELRTPLAGLRTRLEVTALADRSTGEYKAALSEAEAIVLQLSALVDNLLLMARLDAGQVPLSETDVDLRELVTECWKPLAAMAAARNLTFRMALDETARIKVDREKLRIVLGNLLANAAEYTDDGGWIEVSADRGAILAVTDSGPAIPADQLPKLFDRMWRGDAARSGTGAHCGIGLALAKSLCAAMSLDLDAETLASGYVRFAIAQR